MTRARRLLGSALLLALVALAVAPAGAQVPYRENIRHLATVPGSTGGHAVVEGDRLYVGAYGLGMRLFDIADPAAPREIGRYFPGRQDGPDPDPGVRADAVPDAAVFDGRHIAVLNGTSRTAGAQQAEFLDWTDPANPKLLWRFADAMNGESHNGDIVDARRLWLPSGGSNGLRIFDLDPLLQNPPAAPKRLSMNNPVNLWRDSPHRAGRAIGSAFTHIHDIEVYVDREVLLPEDAWVDQDGDGTPDKTYEKRDIALLAEGGSYLNNAGNTGSLFIIDITDPAKPVALLRYQRPANLGKPVRYVHEAQFLQGQPDILVTTDEDLHNGCDAGGATIHRVSEDLTSITELSQWFMGTGTPAAVCSSHVISTKDNFLFMGNYNGGLQVVDLTDPAKPARAGQYIAEGANSWGALVHPTRPGYLVYVGDFGARGLDVFEFVADPVAQGTIAANPATRVVGGVNEVLCGQAGAPTVDGLLVPIPEGARAGDAKIAALGSGLQPYELDIWFYDQGCSYMSGIDEDDRDTGGLIPEGAAYAAVTNWVGAPTYTYVTMEVPPASDGE